MIDWKKYPYLIRKRTTEYVHKFKDRECYNSRDIYRFFTELKRDIIPKSFLVSDFKKIHHEYNQLLQDAMMEGEIIKLPYVTGQLYIKRVRSIYRVGPYVVNKYNQEKELKNPKIVNNYSLKGNKGNVSKLRWGGVPKWHKLNTYNLKREYSFVATSWFKERLNKKLIEDQSYFTVLNDYPKN